MSLPDFSYEKSHWESGRIIVAGVDEVGRGAFAGPVIAGCVVMRSDTVIPEDILINDSKKLYPQKRKVAADWIRQNSLAWSVGSANAAKINSLGIVRATHIAFRSAISRVERLLNSKVEHLLIDAFSIPQFSQKMQTPIKKGDQLSISIAAASIVAKVERDKFMSDLSASFPHYRWENNKGYGTDQHRQALKTHGKCIHHRRQFIRRYV